VVAASLQLVIIGWAAGRDSACM